MPRIGSIRGDPGLVECLFPAAPGRCLGVFGRPVLEEIGVLDAIQDCDNDCLDNDLDDFFEEYNDDAPELECNFS